MGIKSPATYGDYYWAAQVEAAKLYQDDVEGEVSSYVSGLYNSLGLRDVMPSAMNRYVDAMTSGGSFAWGAILARFGSEMADSVLGQSLNAALKDFNYMLNEKFHDERIDAATANTLYQRKNISDTFWASRCLSGGYDLAEASLAYGASLPYPAVSDLMLWARYKGNGRINRADVWEHFDVPADEFDIWHWLTLQRMSTETAHTLLRRNLITNAQYSTELAKIGWDDKDRFYQQEAGWTLPAAMLMIQGGLTQRQGPAEIIKNVSRADIHPDYADLYMDAVLTKPASGDLVAYQLRIDPDLSGLDEQLRRVGVHPEWFGVYKELANVIPPVADIITMAVREAFTPTIAARFGQYEDFPAPLAEWAAKKGLAKEWAERYWAAHWALPSPTQGFQMLHRGVIETGDLDLLLRAQDVMPFWRDKLTQIAYRPLTRVDVRRMYKEGILDEAGVYEAYLNAGYADDNARSMTQFTIRYVLSQQAKFTSRDVISAFTKRMINISEAGSLLRDLGIKSGDVSYILSRAELKRKWDLADEKIAGIRNLYRKGFYNENQARDKLAGLALPAEQITVLFEQWWFEKTGELSPTWTKAETLRFAKEDKISKERAMLELQRMGYDGEHVELYMEGLI